MDGTKIQWTEATWNPVRGCSLVSAGCTNCYAMRQAHRFSGPGEPYDGLTRMTSNGPVWTGEARLVPEHLDDPLHWKRPRKIFVNSMSDLFHESLEEEEILSIFRVMIRADHHIYQVLTKRPERMRELLSKWTAPPNKVGLSPWMVAKHIWLGVSVEDQKTAGARIPVLLETPAGARWVSYEPALGPIDFTSLGQDGTQTAGLNVLTGEQPCCHEHPEDTIWHNRLDWIVVGGESGPGARPFDIQWARDVVAQCKAANVPVFIKQLGAKAYDSACEHLPVDVMFIKDKKGGNWYEWPEDLRVREYPIQEE